MRGKINKFWSLTIITLIIISSSILVFYYNVADNYIKTIEITNVDGIRSFSSYNELGLFIASKYPLIRQYPPVPTMTANVKGSFSSLVSPVSAAASAEEQSSYSKTNTQVEGVDELDIIKTDGKYLYIASKKIVYIIMAYPPYDASIASRIIFDKNIMGMFLFNDKLAVILSDWNDNESYETDIKVYDITNRNNPILVKEFAVNGYYFTSRSVNDYVYLIVKIPIIKPIQYWKQYTENFDLLQLINIPRIRLNGQLIDLPANQIYYFSSSNETYYEYTTIVALNILSDEKPTIGTFLLGSANNLYMSLNNLYITSPKWGTLTKISNTIISTLITRAIYEKSIIYRFSVDGNNIKYEANGEVPGTILNQFSMDELNNHFRVVTTVWKEKPENNLYVLDVKNMEIIGNITGLAPGEWIYSARFIGNRCYLVTFKKTDPLFVIDVKDPFAPKVLGWLKIPGFSNYLHPYDETHLIGIGKDTVEAEQGDFAWYQGVKISLFDVSDPQNPKELAKYIIGDRGSDSPVLHDHKALLFDPSRKILALPVLVAQKDNPNAPPYEPGKPVWQGAYIFNVSLEKGLILIGKISHLNKTSIGYRFDYNEDYFIRRIAYINDILYTISNRIVLMNNLTNMSEINKIVLNV